MTRVTKLPDCESYRFFSRLYPEYLHAPPVRQNRCVAASAQQTVLLWNDFSGLRRHTFRRHTWPGAEGSDRRMLLPLCGIAPGTQLREVVRFKALCLAMAGSEVREAAHADAGQ
jgi:hypothetical protein